GDVEAAGEDGQAAEQGALVVVQQVMAPPDHCPQGTVALIPAPAAGQQPRGVVERGEQPGGTQRGTPCRGELDGQRHAVQPCADFGDDRRVGGEGGVGGQRAVGEQRDGVEHVLAAVQDQQQPVAAQPGEDGAVQGFARLLGDGECGGD